MCVRVCVCVYTPKLGLVCLLNSLLASLYLEILEEFKGRTPCSGVSDPDQNSEQVSAHYMYYIYSHYMDYF
jgi:hypothetical protein